MPITTPNVIGVTRSERDAQAAQRAGNAFGLGMQAQQYGAGLAEQKRQYNADMLNDVTKMEQYYHLAQTEGGRETLNQMFKTIIPDDTQRQEFIYSYAQAPTSGDALVRGMQLLDLWGAGRAQAPASIQRPQVTLPEVPTQATTVSTTPQTSGATQQRGQVQSAGTTSQSGGTVTLPNGVPLRTPEGDYVDPLTGQIVRSLPATGATPPWTPDLGASYQKGTGPMSGYRTYPSTAPTQRDVTAASSSTYGLELEARQRAEMVRQAELRAAAEARARAAEERAVELNAQARSNPLPISRDQVLQGLGFKPAPYGTPDPESTLPMSQAEAQFALNRPYPPSQAPSSLDYPPLPDTSSVAPPAPAAAPAQAGQIPTFRQFLYDNQDKLGLSRPVQYREGPEIAPASTPHAYNLYAQRYGLAPIPVQTPQVQAQSMTTQSPAPAATAPARGGVKSAASGPPKDLGPLGATSYPDSVKSREDYLTTPIIPKYRTIKEDYLSPVNIDGPEIWAALEKGTGIAYRGAKKVIDDIVTKTRKDTFRMDPKASSDFQKILQEENQRRLDYVQSQSETKNPILAPLYTNWAGIEAAQKRMATRQIEEIVNRRDADSLYKLGMLDDTKSRTSLAWAEYNDGKLTASEAAEIIASDKYQKDLADGIKLAMEQGELAIKAQDSAIELLDVLKSGVSIYQDQIEAIMKEKSPKKQQKLLQDFKQANPDFRNALDAFNVQMGRVMGVPVTPDLEFGTLGYLKGKPYISMSPDFSGGSMGGTAMVDDGGAGAEYSYSGYGVK